METFEKTTLIDCSSEQVALECYNNHGIFTYSVLDVHISEYLNSVSRIT